MSEKAGRTPEPKEHPAWVSGSVLRNDFYCYAPCVLNVCSASWCVSYGYLWKERCFGAAYRIHHLDQIIVFDLRLHQDRRVFLLRIFGFQTNEHFGQHLEIVFPVFLGDGG